MRRRGAFSEAMGARAEQIGWRTGCRQEGRDRPPLTYQSHSGNMSPMCREVQMPRLRTHS